MNYPYIRVFGTTEDLNTRIVALVLSEHEEIEIPVQRVTVTMDGHGLPMLTLEILHFDLSITGMVT